MKTSGNSRNAQDNRKAAKSRLSHVRTSGNDGIGQVADWTAVNPKICMGLVAVTASMGGAVRFGYTRDGGAYSVGLYLDDDRETFYFRPSDDIDQDIQQLVDAMEIAAGNPHGS